MAQRNPMNQRYAGDGPKGQTRKSAAKLKPASEAAASVHIDKKPTTKSERKAALKKREREQARKNEERAKKAVEREKAEKLASGEISAEELAKSQKAAEKPSIGARIKKTLFSEPTAGSKPGSITRTPQTPEYKKYKKIYWILMALGIICVVISFLVQFTFTDALETNTFMVPMGLAYLFIISAIVLDYGKIRRMVKQHNRTVEGAKLTPKQAKHEQRKQETAFQLEQSKKAQKEYKRANSKIPLYRKPIAAGDATDASATVSVSSYNAALNVIAAGDATDASATETPGQAEAAEAAEAPETAIKTDPAKTATANYSQDSSGENS